MEQPFSYCADKDTNGVIHMNSIRLSAATFIIIVISLIPQIVPAIENSRLTNVFSTYDKAIDDYISAFTSPDWKKAETLANQLSQRTKELHDLALSAQNKTWEYYSSNLINHGDELLKATRRKDKVEITYLISIHISHLAQIQSANPRWLREHVIGQISNIEEGILTRDRKSVRDAAENIHTSAIKIILSVSNTQAIYKHTRWLGNINSINQLGDEIIGEVNHNNWAGISPKLNRIKHLVTRWTDSFLEGQ